MSRIDTFRSIIRDTDLEYHAAEEEGSAPVHNGINTILFAGNAIPGVSAVTGLLSMAWGSLRVVAGIILSVYRGMDKEEFATIAAGTKMVGLGAAAVFLPGTGNVLNGIAAAKDAIDVPLGVSELY